ncbi:MAG: hypothetical protein GWM90_30020 [Gemmatimonadetes bacterium]|nr:hypothetical protein [Gemmatimonadota bacterium]NIQ59326.1 hypothetical protein [Gemmatimonadota bacterium]NIU79514.1 hypothetical protein [Gammaproteobacteria bacterium]NIX48148.1 hypothetical protein [Gemmatimonadota bacterium]NIY12540.1 hypothetical protein [Gemmatimonadota bacterium]
MFFRRDRPGEDPFLGPKLWLFGIGALLALVGMALENDWLIGAAALFLAGGILLRLLGGRRESGEGS